MPGSASTRDVSSVPGSASTEEEYKGSRKLKQRFEYSENSTAGFVELAPDRIPSEEEFMNAQHGGGDAYDERRPVGAARTLLTRHQEKKVARERKKMAAAKSRASGSATPAVAAGVDTATGSGAPAGSTGAGPPWRRRRQENRRRREVNKLRQEEKKREKRTRTIKDELDRSDEAYQELVRRSKQFQEAVSEESGSKDVTMGKPKADSCSEDRPSRPPFGPGSASAAAPSWDAMDEAKAI